MLEEIIPYIDSNLSALNLVKKHYGFAVQLKEESEKGSTMFPAVYCTGGSYAHVEIDKHDGIFYHRQTGPVTSAEETPMDGCGKLITKSFPLRTVVAVKKTVLSLANDDAFIEGKVLGNMATILNRKASIKLLRQNLHAQRVEIVQNAEIVDRYDLWAQEYSGVEFKATFEYVYAAIDYTVNVTGTPACFEIYDCDAGNPGDYCPSLCERINLASAAAIYACLSASQIEDLEALICNPCQTMCELIELATANEIVDCFSPGKEAAIAALICEEDELTFENAVALQLW